MVEIHVEFHIIHEAYTALLRAVSPILRGIALHQLRDTYGTAQMQLDARAYITRGFFTYCPHQPVRVPAYMPSKDNFSR